ncbi:hypothetical protein CC80DRAFT_492797 [Byssothecium circinans]|uniref:Uncharacterized protein n=1 Tax=Byssothecium circinans TaxID=147558 RepID=A0A6A5TW39_9PLEO|nr:hypothetical protein CC80DRAFT_492797 [Byssothecium circinans]
MLCMLLSVAVAQVSLAGVSLLRTLLYSAFCQILSRIGRNPPIDLETSLSSSRVSDIPAILCHPI